MLKTRYVQLHPVRCNVACNISRQAL